MCPGEKAKSYFYVLREYMGAGPIGQDLGVFGFAGVHNQDLGISWDLGSHL